MYVGVCDMWVACVCYVLCMGGTCVLYYVTCVGGVHVLCMCVWCLYVVLHGPGLQQRHISTME